MHGADVVQDTPQQDNDRGNSWPRAKQCSIWVIPANKSVATEAKAKRRSEAVCGGHSMDLGEALTYSTDGEWLRPGLDEGRSSLAIRSVMCGSCDLVLRNSSERTWPARESQS